MIQTRVFFTSDSVKLFPLFLLPALFFLERFVKCFDSKIKFELCKYKEKRNSSIRMQKSTSLAICLIQFFITLLQRTRKSCVQKQVLLRYL